MIMFLTCCHSHVSIRSAVVDQLLYVSWRSTVGNMCVWLLLSVATGHAGLDICFVSVRIKKKHIKVLVSVCLALAWVCVDFDMVCEEGTCVGM